MSTSKTQMRMFNIHEAKTHLSRLVDEAEQGEPFIIAKAGKPKVKVVRIDDEEDILKRRIGFMKGQYTVPDDIKTPFAEEIEKMFYGEE
jgi:prevent-host-death family protein